VSGVDRLPRITADCSVGRRPSIGDTWWLIAEVQILRARARDLTETISAMSAPPRCQARRGGRELCCLVQGHDGGHEWCSS
jgi:hypothetical protein